MGREIVVPTATAVQHDILEAIFSGISCRQFRAEVVAERAGMLAGVSRLKLALDETAIEAECRRNDGADIDAGDVVATVAGSTRQIAVAEEFAIGVLAKSSGIATAAWRAVQLVGTGMKVVSGAWKKMPPQIKQLVREAVVCGGAAFRITDQPFLYLDKNFVRMLGGIEATLDSVRQTADKVKVIQLKGEFVPIVREVLTTVHRGADIIMVDTGELTDFEAAHEALRAAGCRDRVKLAFAKGIQLVDLEKLRGRGIDILDIGAGIVDAPLLDMRLEVLQVPHAAQSS